MKPTERERPKTLTPTEQAALSRLSRLLDDYQGDTYAALLALATRSRIAPGTRRAAPG